MIAWVKRISCALVYPLLFALLTPASPPQRFEFTEVHMGTQFRIVLYAQAESIARQAAESAFLRIARLDATMSDYNQSSELNRLCHTAVNKPVKVSRDLFRVLDYSQKLAARTGGAFDITVGPLTRLWRRARRTGEMPSQDKIAQALALTGYQKLHLNAEAQTAWLEREGMVLDLGGVAKGFAADEAMQVLKSRGIRSALLAAGGDIVVSDAPPNKSGWIIAIASLKTDDQPSAPPLLLKQAAVSTSGDAEQFVELDGKRFSHILDPRTGLGLQGQSSVTVVARRGTDSDALATAVSVLGKDTGLRLIETSKGAAALFVKKNEQGFVKVFQSRLWKALLKNSKVPN
jgi:thiamine biosynthesis lipoprotein